MDGANAWQRFRHITWPLLSNTSAFVVIIATIASLQGLRPGLRHHPGRAVFPDRDARVFAVSQGFQDFQFGYASAVGWVLILIVFVISVSQNVFFNRRQVTY